MRFALGLMVAAICLAQTDTHQLPAIKTSVTLEGQPVAVSVWATVSPAHLSATVDLGDFQEHLTPILAAQLNRADRCGDRLAVQKAVLAPSGMLTANVHYEHFACAKAFGKEIVKRVVGGDAVVEVKLTPSVTDNHIAMQAEVRKIDANGSLGEALHSGSFGESLRQKIAANIEASVRKSTDLKAALPAAVESALTLRSVRFADGGAGRLWLALEGELHLTAEQFQILTRGIQ
ncbi:MAG TPA: hypothetical protein VHW09_11760 [Bryobacteraceae bacterium]|jgi:hypothetical protein|nr:hypothetical protein [Bryobacteraceae bacterium]